MDIESRIDSLPTKLGEAMRHVEPRPKISLSDIILGGQDGLVNVLGVILGGGVMQCDVLFPLVRRHVQAALNGYVQSADITERIDAYIVPPALGNRAGVLGAIALAIEALKD